MIAADCHVDRLYRVVLKELKESIRAHPERIDNWLRLINTARNLERIADHASNIAAAVIYLKEGDIVRHAVPRRDPVLLIFLLSALRVLLNSL